MRIGRKTLLTAALALTAMALTANNATAQETAVEFETPAGLPCTPCVIHLTGESHFTNMMTGMITARCIDDFTARIYHGGSGEIEATSMQPEPGATCAIENCATNPAEAHWPISAIGETSADAVHATVRFCWRSLGNDFHCNVELDITEPALHDYTFSTVSLCFGGGRRFEAVWQTESDTFEIDHTPDT